MLGTTSTACYAIPAGLVDEATTVAELLSEATQERAKVHRQLLRLLSAATPALRRLQASLARTDCAVARARYAAWCGGVPVTLYDPRERKGGMAGAGGG